MSNTYYKSGQWNAVCDRCGFEFKSGELKKTWDGLWVCNKDWEPRHPQDFIRGVPDNQSVPWNRVEVPDGIQEVSYATPLVLESTSGSISSTDITGNVTYTKSFIIGILTGNLSLSAPTNPQLNETITILLTQDGIGNRTVTWNAVFTGVTLPTSGKANEQSSVQFKYNGTNWVQLSNQPIWI